MRKRRLCKSILALTMAGAVAFAGAGTALADGPGGTPPEMPSGSAPGGTPPSGAPGGPGGSSGSSVTYSGVTTISAADTQSGQTYTSSAADESALLIDTSDAVTITDPTVTKTGDSDGGDNCNFYGLNAAVLAKGGGTTTITGGTITTSAEGANGVFSYGGNGAQNSTAGDGTTVKISDTKITTTGGGSGGIMTTGGGVTEAANLTVETSGRSSAAIRTDRGGGTVKVTKGTYTSNGLGSPAIYSTADITVNDATLVSNLSEGVCIEGKNSITLNNCDLTANNTDTNGNATFYDTIMIYQSMSGDADSGTSTFSMTGGSLTSKNGHVFYVTNTNAVIDLTGTKIVNEDSADVLISVCDDGWSGAGNIATLNATTQALKGNMLIGSDSTLNLNLSGSTFTGKTGGEITNAKGTSVSASIGTVNVVLYDDAVWTLTGDSTVTSISGTGKINYNGYALTVGSTRYTSGSPAEGISETTETPADPVYVYDGDSNSGTTDDGKTDSSTSEDGNSNHDTSDETAQVLQAVRFKNTKKTIKYKTVQKKAVSYSVIKASDGGKVTYKLTKGKKNYITVSKAGKVTVKKGAKKGSYTIKITVAAKGTYKKTTGTIKVVIK
ncbi:MAG: hypothetical protein IJ733_13205 [Lachnospiraceae bacterium]|nr:hypothetical protein [Lachnospiraceae bacterium]